MKELTEYRANLINELSTAARAFRAACLAVKDPYAPLEPGGWNVHQLAVHTRDVDKLVYLHSKLRPSPNGMFLTAVDASDKKMITYIYNAYPGPYLVWDEVLELVRNEWDLTGYSASNLNY